MSGEHDTRVVRKARRAAWAVMAMAALCLPAVWAHAQHRGFRPAMAAWQHRAQERPQPPRRQFERPQQRREQNQNRERPARRNQPSRESRPSRQNAPYRGTVQENRGQRPAPMTRQMPVNPQREVRPAYPRPVYPGPSFAGPGSARPDYRGYPPPVYAPKGHLGAWLNQHRGIPVQEQERMLRQEPSFNRLPQADQQRLVRQLHRVDQMPEAQRERRLARAEALERLSPQQRAQVTNSARQWKTLPPDRQAMMKRAFRDLSEVPPDQRQIVLESNHYQSAFSPEERGILSNLLRVEPYEPPPQ